MERHDLDPIALVFGALFTVLGLAFAIGRWTWFDVRTGWVLGVLLVALGLAGLLSAARRARSRAGSVARDGTPGSVGVEAGLARQAEDTLPDDVLLDLGGAPGDRGPG
jgi:hypothetical protein